MGEDSVARSVVFSFLLLGAVGLLIGCGGKRNESNPAAPGKAAARSDSNSARVVAAVVYVDVENCCDCTRDRQAATWANLQSALRAMSNPPRVEVVHLDTQSDGAQLYLDLKPLMVPPGLYFFDDSEVLVEMLQGEVATDQIVQVLR